MAAKLIQSPVVYNGVVYIGNESARVYALNASDGTAAWASPYDVPSGDLETGKEDITGVSSVAVANIASQDRVYFGCDNGYLYCLNASTKAAADGRVYEGVDTGVFFWSLNASTGTDAASFQATYYLSSPAITSAGLVYVGNNNGNFYKFVRPDLSSVDWYYTTGLVTSSPAISYAVDAQHNRWVFVTSRGDNNRGDGRGTVFAFKQIR